MSVLERYKQRSAYKKSDDIPLSPIETSIYQPSPIESSSLFASSAQADGATPVPQLSFAEDPISSVSADGLATSGAPEASTALIARDSSNDQVALPAQTDAKSQRVPIRIPSTGKKSSGTMLAPKVTGKRTLTRVAMLVLTFLVVLTVLAAVVPLTPDGTAMGGRSFFSAFMRWSQGKDGNTALVASQIATATAVTQDGFDPGGGRTYPGVQGPPPNSGSPSDAGNLNRFFYGQCTYWANMRYHQLTGHWVPWLGNASAWPSQAAAYGWVVSSVPHIPSIMAFAPYVQGAGYWGHVSIAESMNGNAITTSNWNVAGSAWATTTYLTNYPGPGVYFLYYPGS